MFLELGRFFLFGRNKKKNHKKKNSRQRKVGVAWVVNEMFWGVG
jgi:hypothetical protein